MKSQHSLEEEDLKSERKRKVRSQTSVQLIRQNISSHVAAFEAASVKNQKRLYRTMLSMLVVVLQLIGVVLASSGKSGQACDADNPGPGESTTFNEFKLLGHQLQSSIS